MALTLDQLVKMTNLAPKTKEDATNSIGKMTEDQKFELSQICWENIATQYENKALLERNRMLEEMSLGEKTYGPADFAQIEQKIIVDLLLRLDNTKTEDDIKEIKQSLNQYINRPKTPQA